MCEGRAEPPNPVQCTTGSATLGHSLLEHSKKCGDPFCFHSETPPCYLPRPPDPSPRVCSSLDESAEAQWRASGQHLKLQWLSTPSSVLVVYKPVPAVLPSCVHAIAWLLQRGLTVWAEPSCHAELAEAVAEYLLQRQGGGDAGAATGRGGGGVAAALAAAHGGIPLGSRSAAPAGGLPPPSSQGEGPAALRSGSGSDGFGAVVGSPFASYDGQDVGHSVHVVRSASSGNGHASSPAAAASAAGRWGMPPALCPLAVPVDLPRQLRTWEDPPCGCPPAVPAAVGCQLDLVITLGGAPGASGGQPSNSCCRSERPGNSRAGRVVWCPGISP